MVWSENSVPGFRTGCSEYALCFLLPVKPTISQKIIVVSGKRSAIGLDVKPFSPAFASRFDVESVSVSASISRSRTAAGNNELTTALDLSAAAVTFLLRARTLEREGDQLFVRIQKYSAWAKDKTGTCV